jgi:hypothetical protein
VALWLAHPGRLCRPATSLELDLARSGPLTYREHAHGTGGNCALTPVKRWHTPCSKPGMLIRSLTYKQGIVPGVALALSCSVLLGHPAAAQDNPTNGTAPSATEQAAPTQGLPALPRASETSRADRGGLQQTLPDPASAEEVRGQYGWGLMSMIVGGVIVTMALVSLFIFFMRRSWSTSR